MDDMLESLFDEVLEDIRAVDRGRWQFWRDRRADAEVRKRLALERVQPPVVLQGEGRPILVLGQEVKGRRRGVYRVLEALVKDYADGGAGLTRKKLNSISRLKDARKHLRHLCDEARSGADARLWRRVLDYREGVMGDCGTHFLRYP